MRTTVAVELTPIDTFTPHLDEVLARFADMAPAWELVYQAFRAIEAARFAAEGPGWAPLLPSTVANRTRLGYGGEHPILEETGELKASLTEAHHANAVFRPEIDGVFMGTSDPIATYHQDGTSKMVARPVVDMTEADAATFTEIIGNYLFEGLAVTAAAGATLYAVGAFGL